MYGVRPKTTWHLKPSMERNLWEYICSLDIGPDTAYQRREQDAELRGPPPVRPMWEENLFIITTGSLPLLIHGAWNFLFPGE